MLQQATEPRDVAQPRPYQDLAERLCHALCVPIDNAVLVEGVIQVEVGKAVERYRERIEGAIRNGTLKDRSKGLLP